MMSTVLLRPRRPLPRRFRRPVSPHALRLLSRRSARRRRFSLDRFRRLRRRGDRAVRRLFLFVRRWILWAIFACCAAALAFLVFSPYLTVREIRVQRSDARVDIAEVQRVLSPLFGKHLLFLSASEVTPLLARAVPDLADISMQKQYPSQLSVRIRLRPLIARLDIVEPQGSTPPAASGAVVPVSQVPALQDYLAEGGIHVALPQTASGKNLPVIRIVDWAVRPVPGSRILSPEFLARMAEAEKKLTEEYGQRITIRAAYLRAREFHLSNGKISFWFDERSSADEHMERLRILLRAVGLKDVTQYVDLRLKGRIVYR